MFHKNEYKRYARQKNSIRWPIDQPLLLAVLFLTGLGCLFIYDFTVISAVVPSKSYYLMRQVLYAVCGFGYLWMISRIDYHYLAQFTVPMLIFLIVLHILIWNADLLGAIQWQAPHLIIGTFPIAMDQVTEFAALIILAQLLARIDLGRFGKFFYSICALFVCGLPVFSHNLKGALVLMITLCALYFMINKWVLLVPPAYIAAFVVVLFMGHDTIESDRLSAWLDPFSDPSETGRTVVQSIYAIADGGAFGVGLGKGTMRCAVEDAHSAFMLPAIAQEIGLIGVVVILLIYLFFLARAFTIAARAVDRFGFYLSAAIMIRYSVLISLALLQAVNLIPRLGNLALPFLSYGGASLVTDSMLVGILLSVGRYQAESSRR